MLVFVSLAFGLLKYMKIPNQQQQSWLVTLQVPNHVWIRYRKKGIPREMTEKESKQTNQDWAIIGPIKRK